MSQTVQKFESSDFTLSNVEYEGRPVWNARDVGTQLGYSERGKRIIKNIREDWSADFIEGRDFIKIQGTAAQALAAAFDGAESASIKTRRMLLLTESGVNLACMLTRKPVGRALRRWLADEVLPKLRRGEMPSMTPSPASVEPPNAREARLMQREERLMRRQQLAEAKFFMTLTAVDPSARQALALRVMGEATSIDVGPALPALEHKSYSATDVAELLMRDEFPTYALSANLIGRAAREAGIRDDAKFGKLVADKARGSDKSVESWRYFDSALAPIRDAIQARIKAGKSPRLK